MAYFFALLLAVFQAPAAPAPASLDARWVTAFETPPAATQAKAEVGAGRVCGESFSV